jgi:ParB-like chromosome segregation protein Spo0J
MDQNVPKVVIGKTWYWLPFRDRLPPLSPTEYEELKADIAKRGIITPIVGYKIPVNGAKTKDHDTEVVVIDGANRVQIAAALGIPDRAATACGRDPIPTAYVGCRCTEQPTQKQPEALADDLNLHRRHLTPEQRREYIAKVLKDKPQRSNRQVAAQTGTDHKTVGAVRVKLEATGEIPQLQGTEGRNGKVRPARQQAKPAARRNGTPRREPATSTLTAERADAGPPEVRLSSAPGSPSGVTYPDEGWPEGAAPDPAELSSQDLDSLAVQLLRAAGRAEVMSRSLNARFKKDGIPKEEKQALRAEARHLGGVMDNIRQDWDLLIEWTADKIKNGQ